MAQLQAAAAGVRALLGPSAGLGAWNRAVLSASDLLQHAISSGQQALQLPQQPPPPQLHEQPLLLPTWPRCFSSSCRAAAADALSEPSAAVQQRRRRQSAPDSALDIKALGLSDDQELEQLLQVLLHPVPRVASWNGQLSPYLLQVNGQLLLQPSAVLLSLLRALHVVRSVLMQDGHVYVVESSRLLRPLMTAASRACINPNVWFHAQSWSPGTLTNYSSNRRLFKEAHQPNRRLFAAKGLALVNPLCPSPPATSAPVPRLTWDDKWALHARSRQPGVRLLLENLLEAEDGLHRFKPAGSLRGPGRQLRLLLFLDSTRHASALREAYNRNIPTVALTNSLRDTSLITYPILGREGSPAFSRFLLDWLLKVANAAPGAAPAARDALLREQQQAAAARSAGGGGKRRLQ